MIMIIHLSPDQADLEKGKEERAVGHMLEHVPEFKYASIAFNREFFYYVGRNVVLILYNKSKECFLDIF